MEKTLLQIRDEIDQVDRRMIELFEMRMALCKEVAEYKMSVGKQVFDKAREEEKIQCVTDLTKEKANKTYIEELFRHLMSMSRKMQIQMMEEKKESAKDAERRMPETGKKEKVKVVYQGVKGAYQYQAVMGYFGNDVDFSGVDTFRDAMEQVSGGNADYAVLPMENSSAGIVGDVYDLLTEYDNYIVDIYDLPVRHSLLGTPDSTLEQIKKVYSHPQALAQCTQFLDKHPEWITEKMLNTAVGASMVAEKGNSGEAAIASKINAHLYGLKVLQENIQNVDTNTTRFAIIHKKPVFKENCSHLCICFEVKHESGSLYYALSNLIYNNINMTKIESRPIPERPFQYRFYVEMEGNLGMPEIKNALRGMEEETVSFQILGNY